MEFLKDLVATKLPSLITMGIFLTTGSYLVKGEAITTPSVIVGFILIGIGSFLGIIFSAGYMYKEHTENIVTHYEGLIRSLTNALNSASKTRYLEEKRIQSTIKKDIVGGEESEYAIEGNASTPVS